MTCPKCKGELKPMSSEIPVYECGQCGTLFGFDPRQALTLIELVIGDETA